MEEFLVALGVVSLTSLITFLGTFVLFFYDRAQRLKREAEERDDRLMAALASLGDNSVLCFYDTPTLVKDKFGNTWAVRSDNTLARIK